MDLCVDFIYYRSIWKWVHCHVAVDVMIPAAANPDIHGQVNSPTYWCWWCDIRAHYERIYSGLTTNLSGWGPSGPQIKNSGNPSQGLGGPNYNIHVDNLTQFHYTIHVPSVNFKKRKKPDIMGATKTTEERQMAYVDWHRNGPFTVHCRHE